MNDELVRELTNGRGLLRTAEIAPTGPVEFLAADAVDRWAGLFGFALSRDGDATSDGVLFYRSHDGTWHETVSGGARFGGVEVPWTRPAGGWNKRAFLSLGCSGQEFDDEDSDDEDASILVLVHVGFVRQDVSAVQVDDGGHVRTVNVTSPSGAFAVLTAGDGRSVWRYLNARGVTVDEDTYAP